MEDKQITINLDRRFITDNVEPTVCIWVRLTVFVSASPDILPTRISKDQTALQQNVPCFHIR